MTYVDCGFGSNSSPRQSNFAVRQAGRNPHAEVGSSYKVYRGRDALDTSGSIHANFLGLKAFHMRNLAFPPLPMVAEPCLCLKQ